MVRYSYVEAEGSNDCCFGDVRRMDRDLMVASDKV